MEPIRVIYVVGKMSLGGLESRLMDIYRHVDRNKIQFDFLVHTDSPQFFNHEIEKLGGKVISVPRKLEHPIKNLIETTRKLRGYKTMHVLSCSAMCGLDAMCGYFAGVKTRIVNSRSTNDPHKTLHRILRHFIPIFATDYFACSQIAGEWMYTKKLLHSKRYRIIPNAVDAKKFIYSDTIRTEVRDELKLASLFTVGSIARFSHEKQHLFQIEAFAQFHKQFSNSVLVLVGDGPMRNEIEQCIRKNDLEDFVVLTGARTDSERLLQAFDLFLLPSLFEGLPGAAIEAQAAGLKVLISDTVAHETGVVDGLFEFLSITDGVDCWVNAMLESAKESLPRVNTIEKMISSGFEIETLAKWYESFYLVN